MGLVNKVFTLRWQVLGDDEPYELLEPVPAGFTVQGFRA